MYSQLTVQQAIDRGQLYDPEEFRIESEKYMTIDEGYSSSKFAVMVAECVRQKNQIRILYADELDKPLYEEAVDHILRLRKKYGNVQNIGFDGSRPELGMSLKKKIDERYDWQYVQDKMQYCKKHNLDLAKYMVIVPILFNTESRSFMTSHSRRILDDPKGYLVIHPSFDKLVTALKAA